MGKQQWRGAREVQLAMDGGGELVRATRLAATVIGGEHQRRGLSIHLIEDR